MNLRLEALYDDGFVLYLNGTEILRSASMPSGTVAFDTTAGTSYNSIGYETFDLSAHTHLLRLGKNVLCAEVHQANAGSDDLLWDASLSHDVSSEPIVALPTITPAGGVFGDPVQVAIQTVPLDATIYYTLNGTGPDRTSSRYSDSVGFVNATTGGEAQSRPISISVNPILIFLKAALSVSGSLQITLQGQPFQPCVIEASVDLTQWSPILTNTAGADGRLIHVDSDPATVRQRFYRGRRQD